MKATLHAIELQQALDLLDEDLDCSTMSYQDMVLLGQLLWRISNRARDLLQPIKAHFREAALKVRGSSPGPVHFDGPSGAHCTVQVPPPDVGGPPRVSFLGVER